jgi:RHS repeat-associated protein
MSFCRRLVCAAVSALVVAIHAAPAPPPVVSGSTAGSFSVTPSGGAEYRIALEVPPGTNALAPQLSLVYESGGGNGAAGVGFTLEGLSVITRTGMQYLVDGRKGGVSYDANDRFAIDGARLIGISGTYGSAGSVYRTQQESWKKVVANGTCGSGPCSFTVTLRDGTVQSYAAAAPAVGPGFTSGPRQGSIRAWLLSSVTDLNGNSMTVSYAAAPPQLGGGTVGGCSGMLYPTAISYTANSAAGLIARRSVQFFYASRPDPVQSSLGGAQMTGAALLAHIRTYVTPAAAPVLVKDYALSYGTGPTGRSRLASITECDGAGTCLRPTTFSWTGGPTAFAPSTVALRNISSNSGWVGDFNGDGRTDFLSLPTYVACLANSGGSGFTCGQPLHLEIGQFSAVADFNGDGRADFLSGTGYESNVYYSTSAGFGTTATRVTNPYFSDSTFAADFNGDGLADLYSGSSTSGYLSLATTNGFDSQLGPFALNLGQGSAWAADFNGDGMSDLLSAGCTNGTLYLSTGSAFAAGITVNGIQTCGDTVLVSDFNGDGLPDILAASSGSASLSYANGAGFDPAVAVNGLNLEQGATWPADYNADGRADIYVSAGTSGTIYYSVAPAAGGNLFTARTVSGQNLSTNSTWLGDFNGDGISDFYNGDPAVSTMYLGGPASQMPDFLSTIQTGAGGQTSVTYTPMTEPSVYSPTPTGAQSSVNPIQLANKYSYTPLSTVQVSLYPVTPARGALYLVSGYTLSNVPSINAQPYSYSYSFQYAAALMNLLGRGWLGFQSRTELDPQRNARITTQYDQQFPYNLQVLSRATCAAATAGSACTSGDSQFLEQSATAWSCTDTVANAPCVIDNTAYSSSATQVFEILRSSESRTDGQWKSTATTSFTYDLYGNAITLTHTGSTPASALYRCASFLNDTTNAWTIGFLVNEKYSANPGCPGAWNTYTYAQGDLSWAQTSYDSRMNVNGRASWDSANGQFLGEEYGIDAYGNTVSTATVNYKLGAKPAVVPNTTSSTTFDTIYDTFPVAATTPPANPSNTSSAIGTAALYDPRFGTQVGEQNANGYVQTTCLDGFGRVVATQGPPGSATAPGTAGKSGGDTNCLSLVKAFTVPPVFAKAQVVTLTVGTFSPVSSSAVFTETATRTNWTAPEDWTVSRSVTDGLGRVVATADPSATKNVSVLTQTVYLDRHLVSKRSLPFFTGATPQWTTYTYNAAGRHTEVTTPFTSSSGSANTTTRTYCPGNVVITTLNPSAAVTCTAMAPPSYATQSIATFDRFLTGPRALSLSQTADQGALTSYTRDGFGRLLTILAPASRVDGTRVATTTVLDSLGRTQSGSVSGVMSQTYVYDTQGQLASQTGGGGQKLTFTYDGLQRLLTRNAYSSSGQLATTATYTYDSSSNPSKYVNLAGRTATAVTTDDEDGSVVVSYGFGYDPYGNPIVTTTSLGGATYTSSATFNALQEPVTLTYPNGAQLANGYAAGNLLATISLAAAGGKPVVYRTASGFNAAGLPATLTYANGARETFTWTPQQSMLTHQVLAGGATSLSDAYSWDPLGNPLSIMDCNYSGNSQQPGCAGIGGSSPANGTDTFAYTAARLTSSSGPAGTFTYAYDANGNMTAANGATLTYSSYQMLGGTNGFAAVYDANGNMTSRTPPGSTDTWSQSFDPQGNLAGVSLAGKQRRAFQYDDTGRMVSAITYAADGTTVQSTTWFAAPFYEVTTTPSGTSTTLYLDDSDGHVVAFTAADGGAPAARYFHRDQVLSTVRVTGADGAVTSSVNYAPYGLPQVSASEGGDLGPLFNGRPYDEGTGLMDFMTRPYDPLSGVFVSADSIVSGRPTQQDTPQRYAFGWNAPMSRPDPNGQGPVDDILILAEVGDELYRGLETEEAATKALRTAAGAASDGLPAAGDAAGSAALPTAAPMDVEYAAYGGQDKFDKVTKRSGWRGSFVKKTIEKARRAEGTKLEFSCPTCGKKMTGGKIPGKKTRDFDLDHYGMTHADRRALARTVSTRKFGGQTLNRRQFIDLYHEDVRIQCPACNRSHRFEPEAWQAEVSAIVHAARLWPDRFGPLPLPPE